MLNNNDVNLCPDMRLVNSELQKEERSGEFLIAVCMEGAALLCMEGVRHRCGRSDVALIPRGAAYRILPEGENAWVAVWRLFPEVLECLRDRGCGVAQQLAELTAHGRVLRPEGGGQGRLDWLVGSLLEGPADPFTGCYQMAAMELLLIELCRMLGGGAGGGKEKIGETERSQLIKNVITYINEHYQEDIRLSSLARQFWVSPSYLSRQFKSKVGVNAATHTEIPNRARRTYGLFWNPASRNAMVEIMITQGETMPNAAATAPLVPRRR